MSFEQNNSTAMCEARKASPDWHGINVLTGLVKFGQTTLNADRDRARLNAMRPDRQAKAFDLIRRFVALEQEVDALHDEINNELREAIK